ncbi:MAG: ATP-binding protein [Lentimicrobiaceae bacterium]|nr:ATP-binding protein [Lentimicrobiaceae bacterium]
MKQNQQREVYRNAIEKTLHKKEKAADGILSELIKNSEKDPKAYFSENRFEQVFEKKGLAIIIYKKDTLKYWSTNVPSIVYVKNPNYFREKVEILNNGWYEIRSRKVKDIEYYVLILIKYNYQENNEYLKNKFERAFLIPEEIDIVKEKSNAIYSYNNEYLFSIPLTIAVKMPTQIVSILALLFIISYIFFLSFLRVLYERIRPQFPYPHLFILSFLVDILLIRWVVGYFRFPTCVFSSDIFSPILFASSNFLFSLGDTLLHIITLLIIVLFIKRNYLLLFKTRSKIITSVIILGFITITSFLYVGIIELIKRLVIDSSFSLDFNNIFSLDIYSFIGLIIIALTVYSFYVIFKILNRIIVYKKNKWYYSILVILFVSILLYLNLDNKAIVVNALSLLLFYIVFYLFEKTKLKHLNTFKLIFIVLIFAFISSFNLQNENNFKEKGKRRLIAEKICYQRDRYAEYLFDKTIEEIEKDDILYNIVSKNQNNQNGESTICNYINSKYLNGLLAKYNFNITICDSNKLLSIQPDNVVLGCNTYFNKIINENGEKTLNEKIYFINNGTDEVNYLSVIPINGKKKSITLYIEFNSKFIPRGLGYPELLLSGKSEKHPDLSGYSYAFYINNELTKNVGKYYYRSKLTDNVIAKEQITYFNQNEYNHLLYRINQERSIIISKKSLSSIENIASFSYLFIIYCLLLVIWKLADIFIFKKKYLALGFGDKIQISIISIIVVSFMVIGISSLKYITDLNTDKNKDNLREKTHSVLIEIENKLTTKVNFNKETTQDLNDLLVKLSYIYFSDINLYNLNGQLIATSRKEIFAKKLQSEIINENAYKLLVNNKKSLFVQNEYIGNYKFLSAYCPFRNYQNKIIGYLNLPNFAKEEEYKQEISSFLVSYINIYIIIIVLAITIALIVINHITMPLRLIIEKLSKIKLGKQNEHIEWRNPKDEIGSLVEEYNKMIDKLETSAKLLAKSEREDAWQEMAKQVAHEIKNPLTPMKLSVQYLQKAWNDKAEDWEKRLLTFTQTLTEQIDALSDIASAFSDFAQMPQGKKEKIEITDVISNVVNLYKNTSNNIEIVFEQVQPIYVFADKKQLNRVFVNLIKNSIQAIGYNEKGKIDIQIKLLNKKVFIMVSDNGHGIRDDQMGKIFSPNFTTKSGGMGLGLAIVKNIITETGGEITFKSTQEKGTTFTIVLPEINF